MRKQGLKWTGLLLALGLLVSGCGAADPTADQERVVPVRTEQAVRGNLNSDQEIVGVAKASREVAVLPKVSGELAVLHVGKGDSVAKGQLLAELHSRDLVMGVQMEQASLELNQTQLDTARSRLRQIENTAKSSLQQNSQLDEQTSENVLQAALGVSQAEANYKLSELRLQQAQERLADARLVAPADGLIASVGAAQGESVSMQAPLFVIVAGDPLQVETAVSAEQLKEFALGRELEVRFPSVGVNRTGRVDTVSPVANPSGLYAVTIAVSNPQDDLKPGMAAVIRIPRVLAADALIVPTEAVVERAGATYVFAVREETAVRVDVEVLQTQTDYTAVAGELQAGDSVIVRGQLTLTEGRKVNIVEEGLR